MPKLEAAKLPLIVSETIGSVGVSKKADEEDSPKLREVWDTTRSTELQLASKHLLEVTQMCQGLSDQNEASWDVRWKRSKGRSRVLKKGDKVLAFALLPADVQANALKIDEKIYAPFDTIVLNTNEEEVQQDGVEIFKQFSFAVVKDLEEMGFDGLYVITPKKIKTLVGYDASLAELGISEELYRVRRDTKEYLYRYIVDFSELRKKINIGEKRVSKANTEKIDIG